MRKSISCLCCCFLLHYSYGQNVGIGTTSPNNSAILDLTNSQNKGLLIPSMTTGQKNGIGSPANGLLIYQTDSTKGFYFYDGQKWRRTGEGGNAWIENDTAVYSMKKIGIGTGAPKTKLHIAGDLSASLKTSSTNALPTANQVKPWICSGAVNFTASDSTGKIQGNCNSGAGTSIVNIPSADNNMIELTFPGSFSVGGYLQVIDIVSGADLLGFGSQYQHSSPIISSKYLVPASGIRIKLYPLSYSTSCEIVFKRVYTDSASIDPAAKLANGNSFFYNPLKGSLRMVFSNLSDNQADIGNNSTGLGSNIVAYGANSVATGFGTYALGDNSTAMGTFTNASGVNSFVSGDNAKAIGINSFAFGNYTQAEGASSMAGGFESKANGDYSLAMGYYCSASSASSAFGTSAIASGSASFAAGSNSTASGNCSAAMGSTNESSGDYSSSFGKNNVASGDYSSSFGRGNIATGFSGFVAGMFNQAIGSAQTAVTATTPLFIIGKGDGVSTRSNAMVILKNGAVGIGTNAPATKLHIADGNDASFNADAGFMVLGNINGANIVIDNNEIIARNNGAASDLFLQHNGGNIGIGMGLTSFVALTHQLQLSQNDAAKPGSSSWTVVSDGRLKKDIHAYKDGLRELLKINPVWFTYTGEAGMPKETSIGIIAQELQKVAPYMVNSWNYEDSTGSKTYLEVDNGAMTYMLINAVKEQQQQLSTQQAQIDELKKNNLELSELLKTFLKKN